MLAGVAMVIGGMTLLALASAAPMMFAGMAPQEDLSMAPALFALVGSVSVVLGVASGVMAAGLYKGKEWARKILTIVAFVGIAVGILSLAMGNVSAMASLLIYGAVVFYVSRPHVKEYFAKGPVVAQAA
jgi:uncharacterized membrane protein (DUF2068 family)